MFDKINYYRQRYSFQHIEVPETPPSLLSIQKDSFEWFLQKNSVPIQRKNQGLEAVFRSIFPIEYENVCRLEYIKYELGEARYNKDECKSRGLSYSLPFYVTLRLIVFSDEETGPKKNLKAKDIKEKRILFGEVPYMTDTGSFIFSGTERVVVNQLHKSPGVTFSYVNSSKTSNSNRSDYVGTVIPHRGSWLEFGFDTKEKMYARIDRKKKFPATIILRALGYSTTQLLEMFYPVEQLFLPDALPDDISKRKFYKNVSGVTSIFYVAQEDIKNEKQVIVPQYRKITRSSVKKIMDAGVEKILVRNDDVIGNVNVDNIYDIEGKLIVQSAHVIDERVIEDLIENNIKNIRVININEGTVGSEFYETLAYDQMDKAPQRGETKQIIENSIIEVHRKMKPSVPSSLNFATSFLNNLFFNRAKYDLSFVGRMKINKKLNLNTSLQNTILEKQDIIATVKYLMLLKKGQGEIDDIDHLGNRRVRSVGELIENVFRIGLTRIERSIKEHMTLIDIENINLADMINSKPLMSAVNEFFGTNQLSQFMDQTNPLSEITHKRRLSALGMGGLTRDRAGFEVRDVHTSHYGRICPVETPEGPNIGLISSLAVYAKVNEFGFIETPYKKVKNRIIQDEAVYLSALDDKNYKIAQANAIIENGRFVKDFISIREKGDFKTIRSEEAEYIDLAPQQLVSIAASLIPFLEHDDANRALMGSNMQRQAVPLVNAQAPLVGTGVEHLVAQDAGLCVLAKRSGTVNFVDSSRIVIEIDYESQALVDISVDIYHLKKYDRSNQNTCVHEKPLVKVGQKVETGQIIADGSACESGELALGTNVLVAFMSWNGCNFEDSIIISERLLHQDTFTSVHIEEITVHTRDTKLGKENITRDIPHASDYDLRHLDDSGIAVIGSYVKAGDILVGKTTPRGGTQLLPEEKLLRSIFGEKASDVKDNSLKVPPGMEGIVINVKIFNKKEQIRDERSNQIQKHNREKIDDDYIDEVNIIRNNTINKLASVVSNHPIIDDVYHTRTHELIVKKGEFLTKEDLLKMPHQAWSTIEIANSEENVQIQQMVENTLRQLKIISHIYQNKIQKEERSDELKPGILKSVKVYVAMKRKLSVGDKMAGRHGNKGVVSRLIPMADMPYMKDGTIVDVILNPLGVPSRMNVGQILETHLGLVCKKMGEKIGDDIEKALYIEKRKYLKVLYKNKKYISEHIDSISDEQLDILIERFRKEGLYMSTPVFDGANEAEIHDFMEQCGIDKSGQMELYNGQNGRPFANKVTVGYKYMLKLHHLVDEKTHARSVGPYSLVTQQPLGGRSQSGGQRFGEMEVWALEAYGASFLLRELITIKSDDIAGRNTLYDNILKGNHNFIYGIPESFKVLISELRALCIDLDLIKDCRFLEGETLTEVVD